MLSNVKLPLSDTDKLQSENMAGNKGPSEKARYCVKCKQFFLVACFLSEDGTDNSTVCNRHESDKNGLRYCRGCNDFVALKLFPKTTKPGFACKAHVSLHGGGQKAKLKQMSDVNKKRRILAWKLCYTDRILFKQEKIAIRQNEIEDEVMKVDPTPLPGVYAVVPIDCTAMVSPQNIAVVTMKERKTLIKLFQANNIDTYAETIGHITKLQDNSNTPP